MVAGQIQEFPQDKGAARALNLACLPLRLKTSAASF